MDVLQALRGRRTCRAFLPEPVPDKLLHGLLEEAQRAPSGGNTQPWHLYVARFGLKSKLFAGVFQAFGTVLSLKRPFEAGHLHLKGLTRCFVSSRCANSPKGLSTTSGRAPVLTSSGWAAKRLAIAGVCERYMML